MTLQQSLSILSCFQMAMPISIHSLTLSFYLFFYLHFLLIPLNALCRIVFAKMEDLGMLPSHFSFSFKGLITVWCSYFPKWLGSFCKHPLRLHRIFSKMAWIFLRKSSSFTRSVFENGLDHFANILISHMVLFPKWLSSFCEHPHQIHGPFSKMAWIFLITFSSIILSIFQKGLDLSANILISYT